MSLHPHPHVRDRQLRRDAEDLRKCERRDTLNQRRNPDRKGDPLYQPIVSISEYLVADVLRRRRQTPCSQASKSDQEASESQSPTCVPNYPTKAPPTHLNLIFFFYSGRTYYYNLGRTVMSIPAFSLPALLFRKLMSTVPKLLLTVFVICYQAAIYSQAWAGRYPRCCLPR